MPESPKFIDTIDVTEWEVETDTGFSELSHVHKTVPYEVYVVTTNTGKVLECADRHIVFDENLNEVFVQDLIPNQSKIRTRDGDELVVSVVPTGVYENMYDISVNDENHRFYSGDILSHNSVTVTSYLLWYVLFNPDKTVAIVANKGQTARDLLEKIALAMESIPFFLQPGTTALNKSFIIFGNKSKIFASNTSSASIRGTSISILYLDEFAFVENANEFYKSTFPVISSGKDSKIIITSTPCGMNLFYKIWSDAINGRNSFHPIEVKYQDVPGRDEEWKKNAIRDLGSQAAFDQEFGNKFLGSSNTLISGEKLEELVYEPPIESTDNTDVYEHPRKEDPENEIKAGKYVLIADVARGKQQDFSVFEIIDVSSMPYKIVMKYRDNSISPLKFPEVIFNWAKKYNDAFVLIENNDAGSQVSEALHYDLEYDNLLKVKKDQGGQTISAGFSRTAFFGVTTSSSVKRIGCVNIKALIEENKIIINDFDIIQELYSFIEKGNSFGADKEKHDDLVMPLVLFGWLYNQQHFKELIDDNVKTRIASVQDYYEDEKNDIYTYDSDLLNFFTREELCGKF